MAAAGSPRFFCLCGTAPADLPDYVIGPVRKAAAAEAARVAPSVAAHWLYYGTLPAGTSDESLRLLASLVHAEPVREAGDCGTMVDLVVGPRSGTISPWSSKATDIAHVSGLNGVFIERAIRYRLPALCNLAELAALVCDPMLERIFEAPPSLSDVPPSTGAAVGGGGALRRFSIDQLANLNSELGLSLNESELAALASEYAKLERGPTDAELMMYSQVNSEHCRHKTFNAIWSIDQQEKSNTLFDMIRNTHSVNHRHVVSAYSDNAAVIRVVEEPVAHFDVDPATGAYCCSTEVKHLVLKAETHNHPTAIAPFPGAATGTGGELRDEGAVGRGSRPKAGFAAYAVADLGLDFLPPVIADSETNCDNQVQIRAARLWPWEQPLRLPEGMSSPLNIAVLAPLGAAAYGNEFGRPTLCGFFRTLLMPADAARDGPRVRRGYAKPIMLAGGFGSVRTENALKQRLEPGVLLVVLGGPGMLIGLGGGSASSAAAETKLAALERNLASVQRPNPEMERRCQMAIDACCALGGPGNPIIAIHDVGAGGLSNALTELVHDSHLGARIDLRRIPSADSTMSPMEIWCNESQERYVLGVSESNLATLERICTRERCPMAVVGKSTADERLVVFDSNKKNDELVVDMPMPMLFATGGSAKSKTRLDDAHNTADTSLYTRLDAIMLKEAIERVLRLGAVGSKEFLITIGDRTVGGLTVRDQMVGPWQVPVADVAVTSYAHETFLGEAMALGERPLVALVSHAASARMAVGEALLNIAAAKIATLGHVHLSANWMAAVSHPGEGAGLYDAVTALGMELCPALDICIPVGKDSLSMRAAALPLNESPNDGTGKDESDNGDSIVAPMSVNITAAAAVEDVRATLTPELRNTPSKLVLLEVNPGKRRLAASALAQVFGALKFNVCAQAAESSDKNYGNAVPDVDDASHLRKLWNVLQDKTAREMMLAYHDRSDGGLFTTVVEMCFAAHCGVDLVVDGTPETLLAHLFNEELGAVVQISNENVDKFINHVCKSGLGLADECVTIVGAPIFSSDGEAKKLEDHCFVITNFGSAGGEQPATSFSMGELWRLWNTTSTQIAMRREKPEFVVQEARNRLKHRLHSKITFDYPITLPCVPRALQQPKVAILREQGVNSHVEMAYAFHAAGFQVHDVHMTDIISGAQSLKGFVGLAACGGFSFGDVMGAGCGWAVSITENQRARGEFVRFFARSDTFALGVCNGCQMLAKLRALMPKGVGAEQLPQEFGRNASARFEARVVMVEIEDSASVFFRGMAGTRLPVPVAHGEGRAQYTTDSDLPALEARRQVALRYVAHDDYPHNPSGSAGGVTGVSTSDGRITMMMPHPERAARWLSNSWVAPEWVHPGFSGPWMRIFVNVREWVREKSGI